MRLKNVAISSHYARNPWSQMAELTVIEFIRDDARLIALLNEFCDRCSRLGIENNSSLKNLKIDAFNDRPFKMWVAYDRAKNKIVGTAGCHQLLELGPEYFRVLFRGCILPEYRGRGSEGLNKNHLNSFLFRYATPLQIKWAKAHGGSRFVITTNVHATGGAASTDRLFHILEKQKVVRKLKSQVALFSTLQNIWEIDETLFDDHGESLT